jgi:hypothetical protein
LHPDNQGGQASWHAQADRCKDTTKIGGMHEQPGHRNVSDVRPLPWPARPRDQRNWEKYRESEQETNEQKGEGLGIGKPEPRTNETRAPEKNEQSRNHMHPGLIKPLHARS